MKQIDDVFEVHVRGYADGTLDAEIEASREYLEHLTYDSRPYNHYLLDILRKHGIPYRIVKQIEPSIKPPRPKALTPWKPLIALIILSVAFLIAIFLNKDLSTNGW